MKKTVHVISHSHWDREWYMPYEQHHMRLIELIDDLIEVFETDSSFKSFHLDGQTILLDDYLEVKPENEAKLKKLIEDKKIYIGPFYILQDDFLISAEANTRNMLVGLSDSEKWGEPVKLGYFPDTFGNMGQAPQMMIQGGIDTVAFGRGVKTTGFNNLVVDEDYSSKYSEINWKGADGTEILSVLFANWYSNGNEIPTNKEEAIKFWDQKLEDVEKYASTPHLLMMNGVDHQPVQKDVGEAIALANELYPDYHFIHSNFPTYIEAVRETLPQDIGEVEGELTSQETDGWYTLANTSSSRIYLKQENVKIQNLLERVVEPLATISSAIDNEYPRSELRYAWKKLMQNHPHDSICGCSVDSVHRGMMTRFEDAENIAEYIKDEALEKLTKQINTSDFPNDSKPFIVFNTEGQTKTDTVEIEVEWERIPFNHEKPNKNYERLHNKDIGNFVVIDDKLQKINHDIIDTYVKFNYDLPKDGFRKPYFARYVKVRLLMEDMPSYSWQSFALMASDETIEKKENQNFENETVKIEISDQGEINLFDKISKKNYHDILYFDNAGDIGNEYIFKQSYDNELITTKGKPFEVKVNVMTDLKKEIELTQHLMIPESAEELLDFEQKSVTEMRERLSVRSSNLIPLTLKTTITLVGNSPIVRFKTSFNNQAKDHRLRAIFNTSLYSDYNDSESIYEVVKRPNDVSKSWENPSNPQHQQSFSAINADGYGMVVGNIGLHEYEILNKSKIALTIHRGTGELGDWGYFPTEEAQSIGEQTVEYSVAVYQEKDKYSMYKRIKGIQVQLIASQTSIHNGCYSSSHQFIDVDAPQGIVTAFKRGEMDDDAYLRLYNMNNKKESSFAIEQDNNKIYDSNIREIKSSKEYMKVLKPAEIRTVRIPDEK